MALFESYKPFRNRLRQTDLLTGLLAIHAFIQYLQFKIPLPAQFSLPLQLRFDKNWQKAASIFEWEFDTLARELILNGADAGGRALNNWGGIAEFLNYIRNIQDVAWVDVPDDQDGILYELVRIAHRQFWWQRKHLKSDLVRQFVIYNSGGLGELVRSEYNMLPTELFEIGVAILGTALERPVVRLPIENRINNVAPEHVSAFLERFSATPRKLRELIHSDQSYDINWAYNINPLRGYPLIRWSDNELLCPIPPFLLHRFSEGLYFYLVGRQQFNREFGLAFQEYVGLVLRRTMAETAAILPESRYGTSAKPKDSVDWIVDGHDGTLFIEAKASRMRLAGKIDLTSIDAMKDELARLGDFVVQVYRTLGDALNGAYPHWKPGDRPVYPVVVTFDDWHAFGKPLEEAVEEKLVTAIASGRIESEVARNFPYTICSVEELESTAQTIAKVGVTSVMGPKTTGENKHWQMHGYIWNNFRDVPRKTAADIFSGEWNQIGAAARDKQTNPRPSSAPR